MGIAAIVPMKSLSMSKSRLSGVLDPDRRASLSLHLLREVLMVATTSSVDRVIVIGTDERVMEVARSYAVEWLTDRGRGLNHELCVAIDALAGERMASLYIAADLPSLTVGDVDGLITDSDGAGSVGLCPDSDNEGTNGIIVPWGNPFRPLLGHQSFSRHVSTAQRQESPYVIYHSHGWGTDLDSPDDLATVTRTHPGLREWSPDIRIRDES